MQDYFQEKEFVVNQVKFKYLGSSFTGRGVMTWKPEVGFHIEAPLDLPPPPIGKVSLGGLRVLSRKDFSPLKVIFSNADRAIVSAIPLIDRYDVISEKRLSISFDRVLFLKKQPFYGSGESKSEYLFGSALFAAKDVDRLFGSVDFQEVIRVNNLVVFEKNGRSFRGIYHKGEDGQCIFGYSLDENCIRIDWKLPRNKFTKAYGWRLPEAMQSALSILLGQSIGLLQREISWDDRQCIEVRKKQEIISLEFLRPIDRENRLIMNQESFVRLTHFIANKKPESELCCKILNQLLEAARQSDSQIQEFVVASILEAVLRNINKRPFVLKKGDDDWNVYKGLENFFDKFLSDDWKPVHERLKRRDYTYLRHRNAHPDWLFTQGGALSEEERVKSLDSMIFLTRFYGYMILALAGFQNLEPVFPKPHSQWLAPLTIIPHYNYPPMSGE